MSILCWRDRVHWDVVIVLVLVLDPFRIVLHKLHFSITRTRTVTRNNLKSSAFIAGLCPPYDKKFVTVKVNGDPAPCGGVTLFY